MAQTMDEAAKQEVRDALLAWAREQLGSTEERADEEQEASELPQDEGTDVDEVWQSDQAADMNTLLEEHVDQREDGLRAIEERDFSVTSTVRPGAIVEIDGQRYVVGVVVDEVSVAGQSYAGLSAETPLYEAIQGKKAGDSFTFRDKEQTISLVA